MITLAHASHWLVSLAYLMPLVALVGIVVFGKVQDRRRGHDAGPGVQEPAPEATAGPSRAKKDP